PPGRHPGGGQERQEQHHAEAVDGDAVGGDRDAEEDRLHVGLRAARGRVSDGGRPPRAPAGRRPTPRIIAARYAGRKSERRPPARRPGPAGRAGGAGRGRGGGGGGRSRLTDRNDMTTKRILLIRRGLPGPVG